MELFSEIYGCYYSVIAKILSQLQKVNMTEREISDIINSSAFSESAFYILPKLLAGGEWSFVKKENMGYSSKVNAQPKLPFTNLQKAWVKALLSDKRINLFLSDERKRYMSEYLNDTEALFDIGDFYYFDTFSDGDPYDDRNYIKNFRQILDAYKEKKIITITFESGHGGRITGNFLPFRLEYSGKDDKFRMFGFRIKYGRISGYYTINISRITGIQESDEALELYENFSRDHCLNKNRCSEPVVFEISEERNGLERCMLHFASYEKHTEYDEQKEKYICRVYYDKNDETELLIRILSFGPVIRVTSPDYFIEKIKERVSRQYDLLFNKKQET